MLGLFVATTAGSNCLAQYTGTAATQPSKYQRLSGMHNPAVEYFGGGRSRPQRVTMPRMQVPAPRPVQVAPPSKPFSNVQQPSTISPYLALDLFDDSQTIPNYYTYVRPQLNQQQNIMMQAQQMQRMRQQMRVATVPGVVTGNINGGMPTTGHSSQFMNTGTFYQIRR